MGAHVETSTIKHVIGNYFAGCVPAAMSHPGKFVYIDEQGMCFLKPVFIIPEFYAAFFNNDGLMTEVVIQLTME